MNHFIFKNENFKLDDIIVLKNKQRQIEKLQIKKITSKIKYYELELEFVECNYKKIKKIKIYPEKNKPFIKKYYSYNESQEIVCRKMRKSETVYCFECSFCETIHKHNSLGQNDCKCNTIYSPYKLYGYKLVLNEEKISNFNDYLLYNYKLYLKTILSSTTILWYIRYIKQFYQGSLCNKYGVNIFPYLNYNIIKDINNRFSKEPKIKNLITSLKKFIIFMKMKSLPYYLDDFKEDIDKLYKYYNKSLQKHEIKNNQNTEIVENNQNTEIVENNQNTEIVENNRNTEIVECEVIMPRIKDINLIKLDIEIDIKQHISKKIKHEIKYLILNNYDKPLFYHKIKISDKYTEYDDLWLTIQYYNNFIWGISETYTDGVDFINYKVNIMNEKNRQLIDSEDDY